MMKPKPFVIFDPKCTLCLQIKALLMKLDINQSLDFISIYQVERLEGIPGLNIDECHGKVHFVSAEIQIYQGPQAVEEILSLLTPSKAKPLVTQALRVKLIKSAIATSYDLLNSYRLKKRGACEVCR